MRDNGYKVVLTGEGADEVLGGYDLFRETAVRRFLARDPDSPLRARAVELLYPWMTRSPGQAPAFARAFFGRSLDPADPALSHRPRWDSTTAVQGLLSAAVTEQFSSTAAQDVVDDLPPESAAWDPLARAQWLEIHTLLSGYVLSSQGDRMLMAHSVEGRFPYLDPDVVEFADALPSWQKLFGLEEKYLLKLAFADLVPESILRRHKQPYRAPDAACFFAGARPEWLTEVTSSSAVAEAGVFDPRAVAALTAKCARTGGLRMGNTDNMRLVAVLSTQLLHRQFVLGDGDVGGSALRGPADVAVDLLADAVPSTDRSER